MAKHKSNYKPNKSDKFVSKAFIGFGLVFVVLLASILIFNATKKSYAYEDYDMITDFGEMLTQPEEKYVIYYYSETCGFCNDIKDTVLAFADDNEAGAKLYLMDSYQMTGTTPFPVGSPYRNTPTMHVVVNGEITNSYSGSVEIPEALERINNGTHVDFQ